MTTSSPIKIIQNIKRSSYHSTPFMNKENGPDPNGATEQKSELSLPYYLGYLTPNMIKEAEDELTETEERRKEALEEFRQLISKEQNLFSRTEDGFLLQFLRARKFNVKRAFKLLQNYYCFRKEHKDIYDNVTQTERVEALIQRSFVGFLTQRDKKGSIVMICKIGSWDPEMDPFEELFLAITGILLHSIEDPATQVAGYRVIMDVRDLSWTQLKMCTPQNLLLLTKSTQYCFPARYKGIHILTENKLFNVVWAIAYPLLSSKFKKRISLLGQNLSSLQEYIDPSVLPVEFGGQHEPFDNSSWTDTINSDKQKMLDMAKYGYK